MNGSIPEDMARQDEDGFYWLVDRKKDAIITNGKNLYLVQIEDFMSGDPDIQDVAVIGLSDKCLGEIACAVVELKPGSHATEDDINKFCRALQAAAQDHLRGCVAQCDKQDREVAPSTPLRRAGACGLREPVLEETGVAVGAVYPCTPSAEMPENLVKKDGPPASGHRTRR